VKAPRLQSSGASFDLKRRLSDSTPAIESNKKQEDVVKAREIREHMQTLTPFAVQGDVIIFQPVKEETRDPDNWYRVLLKRGDIGVKMLTLDEAQHKSKFSQTIDEMRQVNLEQALKYLQKVRDAHWEFDGYGNEHVLDGEFWDGVDKILDFFCLLPKTPV
jgi:hypothetical protein